MKLLCKPAAAEPLVFLFTFILVLFGVFVQNSLSPELFPQYYLYIGLSIGVFYLFFFIGINVLKYFSTYLYILSIVLLLLTLLIGQVTRGAIRWIPIGSFSFQASEVIRPLLLLSFAWMMSKDNSFDRLKIIILALVPVILIAVQPSFGVALLTFVGLFSIIFLKYIKGKTVFVIILTSVLVLPLLWMLLAPYQKERLVGFLNYKKDPRGAGYNTIQSIISTGSGGLLGRGFKQGFQTQLKYLPEKHTDFVFAAISEELGFVGSAGVLILLFGLFFRILFLIKNSNDETFVLYAISLLIIFIVESAINIGMNLGLLPITGLPLPFISAGGSSLISSMASIGLLISAKSK